MAYDAGMIAALTKELREKLVGAKLEKIHQPEKDEIDLLLRASGKQVRLALSAAPGNSRVWLSEEPRENPAVPPMFCTLLRKHLSGGIIGRVQQLGFERALMFTFLARDELGYATERCIICEMMGKYSNLILADGTLKILGVLRPVDFTTSEKRQLLVGMRYELPPVQEGKVDPLCEKKEDFLAAAESAGERPADKMIVGHYSGISPLVAREIAYRASGMTDCASAPFAEALYTQFAEVTDAIRNEDFHPTIVDLDGRHIEYSFFAITQYGAEAEQIAIDSPSKLIETFYLEKGRSERVHRRAQDLFKLLSNAEARLLRKIATQESELKECAEKDKWKQWGELLTANLYALEKGQKEVKLINYYSEDMEEVTLSLDSRLSPAANAQKFFKRYAKLKNAEKELTAQIAKANDDLLYVRSVLDALDRASLPTDVEEIRRELSRTGYLSRSKIPPSKKAPPMKYLRYTTSGGFTVLCGRNNLQNDALTFEKAEKNDWWFHVHNAPGSHVILVCGEVDDPPARDFTEAAMIAAVNSKLCDGKQVTVDYTKVKNIKKPPRANPGFVIYHTNYSAVVDPDKEAVNKLENKNGSL